MFARALAVVLLALLTSLSSAADLGDELLANPSFDEPHADGDRPAGWTWDANAQWAEEGGNRWVVEEARELGSRSVGQLIALEEEYWKLRVSCRVRVTDVVRGEEGWHNARIAMQFQDAAGEMVGGWPDVMWSEGTTADWETNERDYIVPPGARQLSLTCSLFSTTGKVEWDDVSVKLLRFDPVPEDATLPEGVEARWDLASAFKEETATRGRVCINGLWRFHPAGIRETERPAAGTGWGYLKVPGTWAPDVSRQRPIGPDIWEESLDLRATDAAWYQRQVTIPGSWDGRRTLVNLDNPKHSAKVIIDGQEAGVVEWPGGRVDITDLVQPGQTHQLSIFTLALPLEQEQILVAGPDIIESARADVRFKGLCGDCWLESEPLTARIADVFVKPSVRKGELALQCELVGLDEFERYRLTAIVLDGDEVAHEIAGDWFDGEEVHELTGEWADPKLWDIDQPKLYTVRVALADTDGTVLDQTTPVSFGFREFRIDGKDLVLNGKRIHLRCLDYFNAGRDFGLASYDMARHTLAQARELGFNYVIHSHYDYEAQSFAYLDDTLRAGDEAGFPMSHSIRHVKRIWRDFEDPEKREMWNRVVDYEVRRVRNHPCVFMYAMDHNFTGWRDDQNPGQLDGAFEPGEGDGGDLYQRRRAATLAEEFVMDLDGTRPCYHHQSGSFNQLITLNCYLCWTPLQERMEWVSRWRTAGEKPLFFVEFGLPHQASWGGHREGPFIWRNNVNSEPLVVEYGAIYNGDDAYQLTDYDLRNMETVERVYAQGEPFHISSALGNYWGNRWEHNFLELKSLFTEQTWPAFRTYGVSAILPWDQSDLMKPVAGAAGQDLQLETDWAALQHPGLAPDYVAWNTDWLTCPEPEGHVELTSLGETFARVNRETLAIIAGRPERFTAQDHVFTPGEDVVKQVVVLNDLRQAAEVELTCRVEVDGETIERATGSETVDAGGKYVRPVRFTAPKVQRDTEARITLEVTFDGQTDASLQDEFPFTVVPELKKPRVDADARVACFDPKGLTKKLLKSRGVKCLPVSIPDVPEGCRMLIIGREAIGADGPTIDIASLMSRGVMVLVFEQTEEVLQKLWGFRTASPGTRRVFVRQPSHPVCAGLTADLLRDWRGSSTLLEAYPKRTGWQGDYPREDWCAYANSRTWQWGNYGSVASVVVEKPHVGNWSALLDCEFDLQYSPLLECTSGGGRIIFCQLDLTGRDVVDPVAERVLANLLAYASQPAGNRLAPMTYVGGDETEGWLEQLGALDEGGTTLVLGHGADPGEAQEAVEEARTVVCVGLSGEELSALLPFEVATERRPVTHTLIGRPTEGALVGLGNSDFHWRGKVEVDAVTGAPEGLQVLDTGVFAEGTVGGRRYVLVQFLPGDFDYEARPYLRLSHNRSAGALARILTNCGVALQAPVARLLGTLSAQDLDLTQGWRFTTDPDESLTVERLSDPAFDASGWRSIDVPGSWEDQFADLADYQGIAWYRFEFDRPDIATPVTLSLGGIDDEDWTYLNGRLVGHIGEDTHPDNYWEALREYEITPGDLRPGKNVLVVKVRDLRQDGGITKGPVGIFHPGRWLGSYYVDVPAKLDDPYRYYRW